MDALSRPRGTTRAPTTSVGTGGPRGLRSLPSQLTTILQHGQEFGANTQRDNAGDTSGPRRDRQTASQPQTGRGGKDTRQASRCLPAVLYATRLRPGGGSDPARRGAHAHLPPLPNALSSSSSDAEHRAQPSSALRASPTPRLLSSCFINTSSYRKPLF